MKSNQRSFLKLNQLLILFLSAIAAHAIAGGAFIDSSRLAAQSVAILAIFAATITLTFEGPSLALVILLVQSSSHVILGGNSHAGELRMSLSHMISGLISYRAIRYFELAWDRFANLLISFFSGFKFILVKINLTILQLRTQFSASFQLKHLASFLKYRGPPSDWSYR